MRASLARVGRRRGFSMLEMLIVIAILAILGTLSIVNTIAAKGSTELAKAQEEVTFLLGQARMLALSEEVATRVIFVSDGTYHIERQDRNTGNWIAVNSGTGANRLPGTVTLTGNTFPSQIPQFTPRGTLVVGGTLTLRSTNTQTVQLVGNVASGRFPLGTGGTR